MHMYNLIEYSDSYAKTTGSLWQYCKGIFKLSPLSFSFIVSSFCVNLFSSAKISLAFF